MAHKNQTWKIVTGVILGASGLTFAGIVTDIFGLGKKFQQIDDVCAIVKDKEIGNHALDKRMSQMEDVTEEIKRIDRFVRQHSRNGNGGH